MKRLHLESRRAVSSFEQTDSAFTDATTFHLNKPETYIPSECTRLMKPRTSRLVLSTGAKDSDSPRSASKQLPDYTQPKFESRIAKVLHQEGDNASQARYSTFEETSRRYTHRPTVARLHGDHHDLFYPTKECGLTGPPGTRFRRNPENIGQEDKDYWNRIQDARKGGRIASEKRILATYAQEELDAQQREADRINGKRRQREVYMKMLLDSPEAQGFV